jgi:hypothetical protein
VISRSLEKGELRVPRNRDRLLFWGIGNILELDPADVYPTL